VWFFKACLRALATCDISLRDLESVLTLNRTSWLTPAIAPSERREVIKEEQRFRELDQAIRATGFKAMMGAEAIKEILKRVEVEELRLSCARR